MQTFLPYAEYYFSALCLDRLRLGKQRVEGVQLLLALCGQSMGWVNHPACRMWRGHVGQLAAYVVAVCDEWIARGYRDSCRARVVHLADPTAPRPSWLGDPAFHASHRSNLLRKAPEWYGRFGWSEGPELPYVWPH